MRSGILHSAIVLSSRDYNDQRSDFILAMVTSNIELASTPFDVVLFDWEQANLKGPSAVRMFIGMSEVRETRKIGPLPDADWSEVQARLKRALEV